MTKKKQSNSKTPNKKYDAVTLARRRNYAIIRAKQRARQRNENPCYRVEAPYPHFRYYKKSKHPALITGEHSETEYDYRKVMHGEKDGKRRNEKVEPNPDPTDNEPMYIGKRVRHDLKDNFENLPLPWIYPGKKR